jgi:hypothetical protein
MMAIRRVVVEQWTEWKLGHVDLAAAAVTTNTAIDLVRSLEKQARPVIESYTKTLGANETQLPVYWYSLGCWVRDINDKTCGRNIYAPLLGTDTERQTTHPPDWEDAHHAAKRNGGEMEEWLLDSQSFRWAYTLVQLYCMEFFAKTNPRFKRPPGHEPLRMGDGARPDDAQMFGQARTCRGHDIQWLYDLSFLGNYGVGPAFPFLDEVSRGFRISESVPIRIPGGIFFFFFWFLFGFFFFGGQGTNLCFELKLCCGLTLESAAVHEEADIKLWAVFGVQVFWEVKELVKEDVFKSQPLHILRKVLHGGLALFRQAQELYTAVYAVNLREDVGTSDRSPVKIAEQAYTVLMCLLPERLDEEIEQMGHTSYPNLNKSYLMTHHPILCGILLHTARLMMQEFGIIVEVRTRAIMKMAHLYNACSNYGLVKAGWFDLDHCIADLQGPNIFMLGKPPTRDSEYAFSKAFWLASGAMSLACTAPDCRDRQGKRGRKLAEEKVKSRKNSQGKSLQKLGPVSLMFEDRLCRAGDRYELNEEDLQAITERAAAYTTTTCMEGDKGPVTSWKKPHLVPKKPKSIAHLLSDLSLALDQEVPLISFPYICLNADCTSVIWNLEKQLRSMHPELLERGDMPPGFGHIALKLLSENSEKLWIVVDEIRKCVGGETPTSTDGCEGTRWVMGSLRDAQRASIREKIAESNRKRYYELPKQTSTATPDLDGPIAD